MKTILLYTLTLIGALSLQAQKANISQAQFMKTGKVDCVTITLDASTKSTAAVLDRKISQATGLRSKAAKSSGMKVFSSANYPEIASQTIDIYYRVDKGPATGGAAQQSVVFLFLSLGNNAVMDANRYYEELRRAGIMLESLPLEVRIYDMGLSIDEQSKVLEKNLKDYDKMGLDSLNLQSRLAEIQKSIEDNRLARLSQRGRIRDEKAKLDEMRNNLDRVRAEGREPAPIEKKED